MVFETIKKIFGGNNGNTKLKSSAPVPVEDYVEVEVKAYDDENLIKIKSLNLKDHRDVNEISLIVEAGYIALVKTVHLDRDVDEEYAQLLKALKDKLDRLNGNMFRIGDYHIMAIPHNVVVEKVDSDEEDKNLPYGASTTPKNEAKPEEKFEEYDDELFDE